MNRQNDQKLQSLLVNIGLSEHEAAVYIAALAVGLGTVQNISDAANVKRTTVYSVVEALCKQGLMRIEIKGFKKYYVAEPPDRLETIVDQRRELLKSALPQLSGLYNLRSYQGVIKYYQGQDAIRSAYESLLGDLKHGDFYYCLSEVGRWYEQDSEFFESVRIRRSRKGLTIKVLVNNTESAHEYTKRQNMYKQQTKILPGKLELTSTITFTPDKILFHQIIPPVSAVLLENRSIIQVHKEIFEIMWNSLPD